jgi:hypothetical protein
VCRIVADNALEYNLNHKFPVSSSSTSRTEGHDAENQAAGLPVEQTDRFELALNLKTTKALGADLSMSILLRADEVIE